MISISFRKQALAAWQHHRQRSAVSAVGRVLQERGAAASQSWCLLRKKEVMLGDGASGNSMHAVLGVRGAF